MRKKSDISYSLNLQQFEKGKEAKPLQYIISYVKLDSAGKFAYVASADSFDLLYDGLRVFEKHHSKRNSTRLIPEGMESFSFYELGIPGIISTYDYMAPYLNQDKLSQDVANWILSFRNDNKKCIEKIWLNKVTMLPEIIYLFKDPDIEILISILYFK